MKLVTYTTGATTPRVGVLTAEGVHDSGLGDLRLEAVIQDWELHKPEVERAPDRAPVEEAELLAPLRPRSMRDFMAFEGHVQRAMDRLGRSVVAEWYRVPAYYKGMPDTVIGPDEDIPWPSYAEKLDYELELAAVIGAPGRNIEPAEALNHVFGWTIWNDVSARDTQAGELPIGLGPGKAKDWDGSNVIGPCIATADDLDASDLRMTVSVNGELRGEERSSNMRHSFESLIAYASQDQMLLPGELLGSGTATGGSGIELDIWLQPGDVIEMEIEGIGTLRNRVGARR